MTSTLWSSGSCQGLTSTVLFAHSLPFKCFILEASLFSHLSFLPPPHFSVFILCGWTRINAPGAALSAPCNHVQAPTFVIFVALLFSFILLSNVLIPHNPWLFLSTNNSKSPHGKGIQVMYGGCHRNVPLSSPAAGKMIDWRVLCNGLKSTNLLAGGHPSVGGSRPRLEHGRLNLACPWGPQSPLTGDLGSRAPHWPYQAYLELWHPPCVCVCVCVCLVTQWCLTLCDPMDGSLPGFFVHVISQARILEWIAISSSRGSSPPRDRGAGRYFITVPPGSPMLFLSSFPEVRLTQALLVLQALPSFSFISLLVVSAGKFFLSIHPILASVSSSSSSFFKKNIWVY